MGISARILGNWIKIVAETLGCVQLGDDHILNLVHTLQHCQLCYVKWFDYIYDYHAPTLLQHVFVSAIKITNGPV